MSNTIRRESSWRETIMNDVKRALKEDIATMRRLANMMRKKRKKLLRG